MTCLKEIKVQTITYYTKSNNKSNKETHLIKKKSVAITILTSNTQED